MEDALRLFGVVCLCIVGVLVVIIYAYFAYVHWRERQYALEKIRATKRTAEAAMSEEPEYQRAGLQGRETGMVAVGGDHEPSVNDYHQAREQDQALNDVVMQLHDLDHVPWSVRPVSAALEANPPAHVVNLADIVSKDNQNLPATGLLAMVRMITAISKPVASAGTARHNAKDGNSYYVSIGSAKISCASKDEQHAIVRQVNAESFEVLLPTRRAFLKAVHAHAIGVATVDTLSYRWCAYAGVQECVLLASEEEANVMAKQLNAVYLRAVSARRSALLSSVAQWASSEIAAMQPSME